MFCIDNFTLMLIVMRAAILEIRTANLVEVVWKGRIMHINAIDVEMMCWSLIRKWPAVDPLTSRESAIGEEIGPHR